MLVTFLTVLLVIDAIILILLITVLQQGNEGSNFGSALTGSNAQGFFGSSGGVKTVVRATWICGFLFFAISLALGWGKTHDRYAIKHNLEQKLLSAEEKI